MRILSENAAALVREMAEVLTAAESAIQASGHDTRCRVAQPDGGCTCGAIDDFKARRTEFYRRNRAWRAKFGPEALKARERLSHE